MIFMRYASFYVPTLQLRKFSVISHSFLNLVKYLFALKMFSLVSHLT